VDTRGVPDMFVASEINSQVTEENAGKGKPTVSLSQKAYELIRHKIVTLELPPGSILDEGKLQIELKVGRTPIREALQRLSLEKLVTIVPRRGIFVTDIRITDLKQLFEVRLVMEPMAARLAAVRGSDDQWQQMEAALSNLPDDNHPAKNQALIMVDELCHHILYEAADNKFLTDTLTTLYALSLRLWYFFLLKIGDMQWAIEEHMRLLEALKARDAERSGRLLEEHIRAFQQEIQAAILGAKNSK
jgi:DNA-binding GntR family transcriptional regulator